MDEVFPSQHQQQEVVQVSEEQQKSNNDQNPIEFQCNYDEKKDENIENTENQVTELKPRRLTKAEKRLVKYEQRKQSLKLATKKCRQRKAEQHRARIRDLHEDEIQKLREERKKQEQEIEQKLINAKSIGKPRIIIDLSYGNLLADRECNSLAKELCFVYNDMKHSEHPCCLHLTSFSGKISEHLIKAGIHNWHVHRHEQDVFEVFDKQQLVYLSPDATDILQEVKENEIYVIGGIVDRSVQKGLTFQRASESEVRVVRLPIQEYVPNRKCGSHILNVEHVIRILMRMINEDDWAKVFDDILPNRKKR